MNVVKAPNIALAYRKTGATLLNAGRPIATEKWQGIENPPTFYETLNTSIEHPMAETVEELQHICKANQPWAESHFLERISGIPLNPGNTYKIWPFYGSDSKVRTEENKVFSHTYMERMWPKHANRLGNQGWSDWQKDLGMARRGIRYEYGDLETLVNLLKREPNTRQAYLPIWFPEDTGVEHGGRVPCSIGYHFMVRYNYLHVVYQLRSCDYLRHLIDDLYLANRLAQWVLEQSGLAKDDIKLGTLTTHITSLHIFHNEVPKLERIILG
jgi:hypothetical protein